MANWNKFVNDYANYFSSNQSSGPFVAGRKLAEFYIDAIGTAKTIPGNNALNKPTAQIFKPILDIGFGLGFYLLLKQKKSYSDLKKDPRFFNPQEIFTGNEPPEGDDPPGVDKLSDLFNKLKPSDLADIRSKNGPSFKLKEKAEPKSNKIFDYKTEFRFDVEPEDLKLSILGNNLQEVKDTVSSIGGLPMLEKIISNAIDNSEGPGVVSGLAGAISSRASQVGGFGNLTLSNLRSAAQQAEYVIPAVTPIVAPYLVYLRTAVAVPSYGATTDVTDALKKDGGKIMELYGDELGKFIEVIDPYISKTLKDEEDAENARIDQAIEEGIDPNDIALNAGIQQGGDAQGTAGQQAGGGSPASTQGKVDSITFEGVSFDQDSPSGTGQFSSSTTSGGIQSQVSSFSTPDAIGIRISNRILINAIPTGSKIPITRVKFVTTIGDYQETAQIPIVLGNPYFPSRMSLIGTLSINNIQRELRGIPLIEVEFELDSNQGLTVTGTDIVTRSFDVIYIPNVFGNLSPGAGGAGAGSGAGGAGGAGAGSGAGGAGAGSGAGGAGAGSGAGDTQTPQEAEAQKSNIQDAGLDKAADDILNGLDEEAAQKLRDKGLADKIAGLSIKTDPYDVMAAAIIIYWTALGLMPTSFAGGPVAVLPANIPYAPGTYIILFPGLPFGLSKRIRKAFNVALDPRVSPIFSQATANAVSKIPSPEFTQFENYRETFSNTIEQLNAQKVAVKLVASKLSVAFALHLLSLKFLYFGSFQTIVPVPCPGFVLLVK